MRRKSVDAWDRFERMLHHLRDEHRLKKGCDYCYMMKYPEKILHIFVWSDLWIKDIEEHIKDYDLDFKIDIKIV